MDSDLQFILGDSGVSQLQQVSIARHCGSLRKFTALGDDRAAIRTACLQDFAIACRLPENRSQIAAIVSAWETSKALKSIWLKRLSSKLRRRFLVNLGSFRYMRDKQC